MDETAFRDEHLTVGIADYLHTSQHLRSRLLESGVSFEGAELGVSLVPTILTARDVDAVSSGLSLIRRALLRVAQEFIDEGDGASTRGSLQSFFSPYQKWFSLVLGEQRRLPHFSLMRFDAAADPRHGWQIFETNTCCPGGVIHCAKVRDAWSSTHLARRLIRGARVKTYPVDSTSAFTRFLFESATRVSGSRAPIIAIASYKGFYTNEVTSLREEYARMVRDGELPGGEIVTCDIRQIACERDIATVDGRALSLIYNKLDPLMIQPDDPEIQGWIAASRSPEVDFLNSLAAMYLTETKRVLALLTDPGWQSRVALDAATREAIAALVPPSYTLDGASMSESRPSALVEELQVNRARYVLKADALTRGQGVHLGKETSPADWQEAIASTARLHGIAQRLVDIPVRMSVSVTEQHDSAVMSVAPEYYGADFFFLGEEFGGVVSRSHRSMVFNVGCGGKESPVIILDEPSRVAVA